MKRSVLFILALLCLGAFTSLKAQQAATRFVGGDISMLSKYEQYNSPYLDAYGQPIDDLLVWFVQECGWNTFRVRIFVNPGTSDPSVCQTTEYVTALGKRIKDAGAYFMLDFHYSDTWVDATHIQAPAAWKNASDAAMADSVAAYTHRVLQTLKAAGATPDIVQVGNEIMYGLCGIKVAPYAKTGVNWDGYLGLLRAGCNAVREECPDAQIVIHTDRPTNSSYNNYYYKKLVDNDVDFDIIGLSYYPFWHGYLTNEQVAGKSDKNNLVKAIQNLATQFTDKRVHIVECAYNFQWWPTQGVNYDTRDVWTCDVQGQYNFVKDLVDALYPLENVDGINYWFPEEAGNGDRGSVITDWLNRGFWDENKNFTSHAINKTGNAGGFHTAEEVCAPYYMKTFLGSSHEAVETVTDTPASEKRIEDGRLIIRRGERTFNALGQEL